MRSAGLWRSWRFGEAADCGRNSCGRSAELAKRADRAVFLSRATLTSGNNNNNGNKKKNASTQSNNNKMTTTTTTTTTTLKAARIVVIGAGASGIAAATRLLQSGCRHVLLLEAENRIGGRVHTLPFADNVVDLGAQWCHGEKQNPIYEMVQADGLLDPTGTVYDDYKCVRSNREIVPEQMAEPLKSIAFNSIPERQTELRDYEGSLGAYLTEKFWRELENWPAVDRTVAREFFENFKKFESSVEASDHLFEVSGKGHLDYWLCDGELLLNWKDKGFRRFLKCLMRADPERWDDLGALNQRVRFNCRVAHIDWRGDGAVRLRLNSGELIEADHVICTASLGVLKEQHTSLFTPALPPAKCRAIEGLKLGTVDKFFLEFEAPFAPVDWPGFCFLWLEADLAALRNDSELFWLESVFGFYRVSHQPRLLQGWIIGPHARHMETLPEAQVLSALLWLFRKFFSFAVPEPVRFLRTQWHANPHFRGSYTFRSMLTDELRTGGWDLAAPLTTACGRPRLQFAGEATHSHYYSTVHGAVESGWREAQRLVAHYQGRPAQL